MIIVNDPNCFDKNLMIAEDDECPSEGEVLECVEIIKRRGVPPINGWLIDIESNEVGHSYINGEPIVSGYIGCKAWIVSADSVRWVAAALEIEELLVLGVRNIDRSKDGSLVDFLDRAKAIAARIDRSTPPR